jgi:hypothetical protein
MFACAATALDGSSAYFLDGMPTSDDSLTRIAFLDWATAHGTLARHVFPRDAAPGALSLIWTTPFDIVVLAVAAPSALFHGWHDALRQAAFVMPAVTLAAACASVAYLCLALGLRRAAPWAAFLVPWCGGVCTVAMSLPVKHQMMSAAVATAALAASVHMALQPSTRRAIRAACLIVLTSWMSMETVPEICAAGAVLVAAASTRPGRRDFAVLAAALAAAALVPIAMDPDPDGVLSFAIDRYSLLHVTGIWLLAAAVLLAPSMAKGTMSRRVALGCGLLTAAATLCAVARSNVPAAFSDPLLQYYFLKDNLDMQASWRFAAATTAMALPSAALILLAWGALRRVHRRQGPAWLLAVAILLVEVVLGWRFQRLGAYPSMLSLVVFGAALSALARSALRRLPRADVLGSTVPLIGSFLIVGILLAQAAVGKRHPVLVPAGCQIGGATAAVIQAAVPDRAIVMADLWFSPELLARTKELRTVAGPYHRNVEGIRDVAMTFGGTNDPAIRAILDRRHADFLLACLSPRYVGGGTYLQESLAPRLYLGKTPSWLEPIEIGRKNLKLYRVIHQAPAAAGTR